jgi:hypothetical protein
MLAGKITRVHAYTESQLAELAAQADDTTPAPSPLRTDGVPGATDARPSGVPARLQAARAGPGHGSGIPHPSATVTDTPHASQSRSAPAGGFFW